LSLSTITILYGTKRAKVTIDPLEPFILADHLTEKLELPIAFNTEFLLKGLKGKNDFVEFEIEEGTGTSYLLNIENLKPREVYEAIFEGKIIDQKKCVILNRNHL
jgi:hypothetical protein